MKGTKKTTANQAMRKGKVPKKKKPFSFRKQKGSPLSTFSADDQEKVEEGVASLREKGRERLFGKGD